MATATWPGVVAIVLLVAACSTEPATSSRPTTSSGPSTDARTTSGLVASTGAADPAPYRHAVDVAAANGMRVWLETDLVAAWKAGRARFDLVVRQLGELASRPGVVGIKIADELGYHDGLDRDPQRLRSFLHDARAGLARAAPGKALLIDLVIPELGCAPGRAGDGPDSCRARTRAAQPALALDQIDRTLATGDVDVVDVSTSLLDEKTYRPWGLDREQAQRLAWAEVTRRAWSSHVRIQARKALAFSQARYPGTAADAERDLHLYLDIPVEAGATAVDIWAWRQRYEGRVVHLMDDHLQPNPLWAALADRRQRGARLFTHFTPSQVSTSTEADLEVAARVFTDVFVAAGLG